MLREMMEWCQRKATEERERTARLTGKGSTVSRLLKDNQFTFGQHSAAAELGISREAVRHRMKRLVEYGAIEIDTSDPHYSVVTVRKSTST